MTRRIRAHIRCSVGVAVLVFGGAGAGCSRPDGVVTLVLLDGSCSRVNLPGYRDAWDRVIRTVSDGDRLVLGRVTSDLREFRPDVDVSLAYVWPLLDNPLERTARRRDFDERAAPALEAAIAHPCSQRTALIDTLDVAARLLVADGRPARRLVVLSDMLEDSALARFERGLTTRQAERLLESRRAARSVELTGVAVHVVGAAAPTTSVAREVERFWIAYFRDVGATLTPEHYGPVLFAW